MVPSVFTPQAKEPTEALTDAKVPAGGVASLKMLLPQQAMVSSVLTPQANN